MQPLSNLVIFDSVRWIILFIEAYAAKRIYHASKSHYHFQRQLLQIRLMYDYLQTEHAKLSDSLSTSPSLSKTSPAAYSTQQVIGQALHSSSPNYWRHLASSVWIGSIYCTSLIVLTFLMHPFTGYWITSFLPLFLPLLFLPLPYLLNRPPLPTLLILGIGIGLGAVTLLFSGI